jgi:hypothetical protein
MDWGELWGKPYRGFRAGMRQRLSGQWQKMRQKIQDLPGAAHLQKKGRGSIESNHARGFSHGGFIAMMSLSNQLNLVSLEKGQDVLRR